MAEEAAAPRLHRCQPRKSNVHVTTTFGRRLLALASLAGALAVGGPARADNGADPGLPPPTTTTTSASAPALPDVGTDFDPLVDGFRFVNTGDYATTKGNCLGMTLVAIDSYRRRSGFPAGQQPPPRPARDPYTAADAEQQALAANAHLIANAEEMSGPAGIAPFYPTKDPRAGLACLEELKKGNPVVLSMLNPTEGGHAVVAYAYKNGQFLLYDPNYPATTQTIPFDPAKGFGTPSQTDSYYAGVTQLRAIPQGDFSASVYDRIGALRTACADLDASCTARYRPFRFDVSFGDGVAPVLTGTIGPLPGQIRSDGGGISSPSEAIVFLDGQAIAATNVSGNDVRIELPKEAFGPKPAVIEVAILAQNWGLLAISRKTVTPPATANGGPANGFTSWLRMFWE